MRLSIIVPMLNEAESLPGLLEHLHGWERRGCEVLLVDGGSRDGSAEIAETIGFRVLRAPRGRASQMNEGARYATGDTLLFLHADTRLPAQADRLIRSALAPPGRLWGRFNLTISGTSAMLPLVAAMINLRSRLTGIATGDQAIFVRREVSERLGGFPLQPLMEDVEMSARLRRLSPPVCIRAKAVTSGRRWEALGVCRTVVLMWRLRWAYWRGANPAELVRDYR